MSPTTQATAQAVAQIQDRAPLRLVPERDPVRALTPREREVLGLMADGHGNAGICQALFIAPKTLERHVQNIFLKLDLPPDAGCHRRVSAVLRWLASPESQMPRTQVFPAPGGDRAGCVPGARSTAEDRLWMQHA
jgi:DNA-binding NarL/FixJ family response regulator